MKLEGRVVVEEFDCEALKGNPLGILIRGPSRSISPRGTIAATAGIR